jgi:hypothetical protein
MRLDLVHERDAVVYSFTRILSFAFAGETYHIWRSAGCALVDQFVCCRFEPGVILDFVEAFRDRSATRCHRGDQTVLLQYWPVLWRYEIQSVHAQPRGMFAPLLKWHTSPKHTVAQGLL